jgi:hypothetical protein
MAHSHCLRLESVHLDSHHMRKARNRMRQEVAA